MSGLKKLQDMLVVCGLDGVLLEKNGILPGCNRAAAELFMKMGGRLAVYTDRSPETLDEVLQGLVLNCPAIACGGAVLYDTQTREHLEKIFLQPEMARNLLASVLKRFPEAGAEVFVEEGRVYIPQACRYTQKHLRNEKIGCIIAPFEEIPRNWSKIRFLADPVTIRNMHRYLEGFKTEGFQIQNLSAASYEILPALAGRTQMMKKLCIRKQIPAENVVVIAGNMQEQELMQAAGYSVALNSAPRAVKLEADRVVSGCKEGGAGECLYSLVRRYT